jgi:hypothetical protein
LFSVEIRGALNYTDSQPHHVYLATDVEGLYAPERYAQAIYKAFNVAPIDNSENYYKKCSEVGNENNFLDIFIDGTTYRMEEKYLFTPVSYSQC